MSLYKKEVARSEGQLLVPKESPIIQALENLSKEELEKMKKKFDVAYLVATANGFPKVPKNLCSGKTTWCGYRSVLPKC